MLTLSVFAASSIQRLRKLPNTSLPGIKPVWRMSALLGLLALTQGPAKPVYAQSGDTVKPTVGIAVPGNTYSYKTLAQASGTASDTGGSGLASVRLLLQRDSDKLFWTGSAWGASTQLTPTGRASWTYSLPSLADNKYILSAIARDGAGNSTTATASFFIDNLAPVVTVTAPTASTTTPLAQATGTARDAGGGTAQVRATLRRADGNYWNGTAWVAAAVELTAAGTDTWSLNLPSLPVGQYTFSAFAQDYIGNKSAASTVVFTIAPPAKPTISIAAPGEGFSFKTLAEVSGTATGTNLTSVRVILQRNSDKLFWTGTAWGASTELAATGTTSWTYKLPALADNRYIVSAIVRDAQANVVTSKAVNFYIDNLGPVVTITTPTASSYSSLAQAIGTVTDAGGGTAKVIATLQRADKYYWNGKAWVAAASGLTPVGIDDWSLNLPSLPLGKYTLSVIAQDFAGNKMPSKTVVFTIIAPAKPTIAIASPGEGFSFKTLAEVSGTATGTNLTSVRVILQRNSDKLFWTGTAWGASTELTATGTTSWTYKLPALADNRYIVSAIVRDAQANVVTSKAVNFYIDNVGPVVTITTPTASTYGELARATGTVADAGGGTARIVATLQRADKYYWNGKAWVAAASGLTPVGIDDWSLNLPPLPLGKYTLSVIAQDFAGNKATAKIVVFTIAVIKPTITITEPGTGFSFKTLAEVSGTAAGTSLTSVRVTLQRDSDKLFWTGTAWGASTELAATGTSNWAYKLPALADNRYIVTAIVRDSAGASATSTPVTFIIDNLGPVIKITTPANATYSDVAQAIGTVADAGGGTAKVRATLRRADGFYWNGTAWAAAVAELTPTGIDDWTLNFPSLPLGTYTFAVSAEDFIGNKSTSAPVNFTIAIVPLSVAISEPGPEYSYKTLAQVSGTAAGTGLASVRVRLQRSSDNLYWTGSTWGASTELLATGTSNWTYTLPALADGRYTVTAISRDASTNSGTSTPVDFYIDNSAPVVTITTPLNATYIRLDQANGTARDAIGGIAQVRVTIRRPDGWYWNGTAFVTTLFKLTPVDTENWSLSLSGLPAGNYAIQASAQDYSGNEGLSPIVNFGIVNGSNLTYGEDPPAASAIGLSTASAKAAAGTITLVFTGALNPGSAVDSASYSIRLGGQELPFSAALSGGATTVTIALPGDSVQAGDALDVSYSILDNKGLLVDGNVSVTAR